MLFPLLSDPRAQVQALRCNESARGHYMAVADGLDRLLHHLVLSFMLQDFTCVHLVLQVVKSASVPIAGT